MADSVKEAVIKADTDHKIGQSAPNTSSWSYQERSAYDAQAAYLKRIQEDANRK